MSEPSPAAELGAPNPSIIVGIDGSGGSQFALRWAIRRAEAHGHDLVAMTAYRRPAISAPMGYLPPAATDADVEAACRRELAEVVETVVNNLDSRVEPTMEVELARRPAVALCKRAEAADLLVVGCRGREGFPGLHLGSVAEYCLHRAEVPLALVPRPDGVERVPSRITVGVDGSDLSVAALRWALEDQVHSHLPIVALTAWSWIGTGADSLGIQPGGWDESMIHNALEATIDAAGARDRVTTEFINDVPSRPLLERSSEGDLVVVGAQANSAVRQFLAGSVSRQLAHHATGPVVIVRQQT